MNIVQLIAEAITEDPDIMCEEALSSIADMTSLSDKPLSPTEINKEAEDIAGDQDSAQVVQDQLQQQQDAQKQQQVQKQRVIQPQITNMKQSLGKLGTGIQQSANATNNSGNQLSNLNSEIAGIQTLLNTLGKSF